MSFDMWLGFFEHGKSSSFNRSIVWDIFGPHLFPAGTGWQLYYDDHYNGDFSIDDTEEITGVSVNRPGERALIDFYQLACLVPSAIYWGTSYVVTNADYISGLPKDMIAAYKGEPHIVGNVDEFFDCLSKY